MMKQPSWLQTLTLCIIAIVFIACEPSDKVDPAANQMNPRFEKNAINELLDNWHEAAADADGDAYFSAMAESSIFMGTDASEYWTKSEFKTWSQPYFDRGKAWSFTPKQRNIYFSDQANVAWFDEVLETPNLGPSRGTGVVTWNGNAWKIAHYNLSIPIPNDIVDDVVNQVEDYHNSQ